MHDELNESPVKKTVSTISAAMSRFVLGHNDNINLLCGAFIIGGHVLVEGPPGIAKTLLVRTFAHTVGLRFSRIQFTPDLMPTDVTGVYVFDQKSGTFRFAAGPVFADIILADEINRTPPKTQSALLEAMEERFVTIDGVRHPLDPLFFVAATQNPIEHEGTFPLPEAQLDRFLFKLGMSYPEREVESQMIEQFSGSSMPVLVERGQDEPTAVSRQELGEARAVLRSVRLEPPVADYIIRLAEATRSHPDLLLGASPRAALHLALAAKFNAAMEGRTYVIPDDVQKIALPVLAHRLVVRPEVYEDEISAARIVSETITRVAVPDGFAG